MRFTIILLFFNFLNAQENKILSSYRSFEGGLNDYYASISLQDNESPDLLNVVIDEPIGALTQRKGYIVCGQIPSGKTITNLYEYVKVNGTRYLIITDNENIWQTADCVNFSTITAGLNGIDMPRFATVRDKLWIVNSSTWTMTWDGENKSYLTYVPKAKYITYWKARGFLANENTNPSSVYFSKLVSSSGTILSPEDAESWSSVNQIYINRDDGSPIYGMKVYRDNLYIFKETGITRVVFESEEDIGIVKNVSTIGSKFNESIVEMDDGLLRFVGRDGVYAFDGSNIKRLSTKWTNNFEKFKQGTKSENFKLWDNGLDFIKGNLNNVNTYYFDNSLSLNLTTNYVVLDNFDDGNYSNNPVWTISGNANLYIDNNNIYGDTSNRLTIYGETSQRNITMYTNYNNQINLGKYSIKLGGINGNNAKCCFVMDNYIYNNANGYCVNYFNTYSTSSTSSFVFIYNLSILNGGNETVIISSTIHTNQSYLYKNLDVIFDLYNIRFYIDNNLVDSYIKKNVPIEKGNYVYFYGIVNQSFKETFWTQFKGLFFDNLYVSTYSYNYSGTYTSEISTFSNISQWKTFEVNDIFNEQQINYFYKSSNTINGVINSNWVPINKGQIISANTGNQYFQWKADLQTFNNVYTPIINSVLVSYVTGDTTKSQIFGTNYKSRYWLSASTSPNNQYNDLTMVESKSPLGTYTKFDLPITAYSLWNGILYGGIADKGYIARLDYGDNDNGNTIISYWDTKDELFGSPIHYKSINRAVVDYSVYPINDSLQIGLSSDFGNNFEYKTINTGNNINLQRNTSVLNYSANRNLQYRLKIYNNKYNTNYKIYGLHMIGTIGDYIGSK